MGEEDFKECGVGSEEHRQRDHNMINYIFLILSLQLKNDSVELIPGPRRWTAQELYILECVDSGDIMFFPQGETLCLNKGDDDDEGGLAEEVEANSARMGAMEAKIEEMMNLIRAMASSAQSPALPSRSAHANDVPTVTL